MATKITNLVVRPFEAADLPALLVLERSSVTPRAERRSLKDFGFMMSSIRELILVAVLDGQIVGYAGYSIPTPTFTPPFGLHRIVVNKEFRRRGIGQALLNELLAIAAEYACVECNGVPVKDKVSQQFLSKNGFEDSGALSHQYIYCSMARRKRR